MDIIGGRSNIISAVVHNRLKLRDDLWVSLDLHLFGRPEGANSGYTGLEGNLGMGWLIGRGLSLRGGYGLFAPAGDAFGTARPAHFGELELRYTR